MLLLSWKKTWPAWAGFKWYYRIIRIPEIAETAEIDEIA